MTDVNSLNRKISRKGKCICSFYQNGLLPASILYSSLGMMKVVIYIADFAPKI